MSNNSVRVCLRLKPSARNLQPVWRVDGKQISNLKTRNTCVFGKFTNIYSMKRSDLKIKKSIFKFNLDEIFDEETTTVEIFEQFVSPFLDKCRNGFKAVVFVYGHSGSGKSHTVFESSADNMGILRLTLAKSEADGVDKNDIQ